MKKVAFVTLGCKVNTYDSASMQTLFLQQGFELVEFGQKADIVVVNTCTVTAAADKKSRAMIRRAAETGRVIVVGCLAQRAADAVMQIEGVGAVIGTDKRSQIVEVAQKLFDGQTDIDLTRSLEGCGYEPLYAGGTGTRTRGILKIQEGCDCFCSYCIIPYVRGRSRSRRFDEVIGEASAMAKNGTKEIVLTGIHIASYNDDGKKLGDVIEALGALDGVRIRLGSLEPGSIDFVDQAAKAHNFCPHFHLSLQSGSPAVLRRMNRPYTPEQYLRDLSILRDRFDSPAITTDVIAGFPAETEEEHAQTMAFVEKAAFARLHVFPFSPREGTKAYGMEPRVPKRTVKARAAELIALGDRLEKAYVQSRIGKKARVLLEEPSDVFAGLNEGYCERYVRIAVKAEINQIKTVTVTQASNVTAFGISEGEEL